MRIKSLKVSGFKSFCHAAELEFKQKGISVIVGPNGCGKSNVVDAIKWVLGEQSAKQLRGGAMEDVIFAGSTFQKPLGMAEVALTFSNEDGRLGEKFQDFSEIEVSRRLFRSGESQYLLNRTPVRLLDVRELFMDTGVGGRAYSIIEQGRVGEVVSAKPQDRRLIIEDAAGIVKFKMKRQTAERRLEETQQNLLRIEDVLRELKRQEELLADQVEKAQLYLNLKQELQELDQKITTLRWKRSADQEALLAAKLQGIEAEKHELHDRKIAAENRLEELTLELARHEQQLEALREVHLQKERQIQDIRAKISLEEQNLENSQDWIEKQAEELRELELRLGEAAQELEASQQGLDQLQQRHQELAEEVRESESARQESEVELQDLNEQLQQSQKDLLQVHTQITSNNNRQTYLEEQTDALEQKHYKLLGQLEAGRENLKTDQAKQQTCADKVEELEGDLEALVHSLNLLEEQHAQLAEEASLLDEQVQEKRYLVNSIKSHLESLEKIQGQFEDFGDSVKQLFKQMEEEPGLKDQLGVVGVMAEFLATDVHTMEKLGGALGRFLEIIVLYNASFLPVVERFCQENDLGGLQFYALGTPINPLLPSQSSTKSVPLANLLNFSDQARELNKSFFKQVMCAQKDDFWQERQHSSDVNQPWSWITPQGNYIDAQGTLHIGKGQEASLGFMQRKVQIEELKTKLQQEAQILEGLEERQQVVSEQKQAIETTVHDAKNRRHEIELTLTQHTKELEHARLEVQRTQSMLEQLQQDQANLSSEMENAQSAILEIQENLAGLETQKTQLEQQGEWLRETIELKRRDLDETGESLMGKKVALTETAEQVKALQATMERLRKDQKEAEERKETLLQTQDSSEEKINQSRQHLQNLQENLEACVQGSAEMQSTLKEQLEVQQTMTQSKAGYHKEVNELRGIVENKTQYLHENSLRLTELRMQREQLEETLYNDYEIEPKAVLAKWDVEALDEGTMTSRLRSVRGKLNQMDQVNLAAPDEYAELKERLEFLIHQSADLQKAISDLNKTIREINVESRRRFKETFEKVNERFKELFRTLFGGGEARMELVQSDDLLEAGIDIKAMPPGKKLQNMNLLSGGEKALTAISLIFAIFSIKPSPFCLLDEVDAPLDDANVGRFNQMIHSMTGDSQFIVITHNKKTMEIGDLLYGVTMEEPGVSKIVSVQFKEATAMV